jgi:TolB-like protein
MFRQMSYATRMLAAAAAFAVPTAAAAQDNRPVVVVFTFENSSVGAGAAEFAGVRTGIQDLLITDLASNAKIRLVDRAHLNEVMTEQNMVKDGRIDPATAVRLGRVFGAQYAVTGGFMSDGRGNLVLTGRTIDMETTQIANPQKVSGKADNVLDAINELTSKLSSNMNLAPKPGAGRRSGGAETGGEAKTGAAQSGGTAKAAGTTATELYAKPTAKPVNSVKLDGATLKIYSAALDEMDKKNNAKAKELFNQVLKAFPSFEPAERNLKKLG